MIIGPGSAGQVWFISIIPGSFGIILWVESYMSIGIGFVGQVWYIIIILGRSAR